MPRPLFFFPISFIFTSPTLPFSNTTFIEEVKTNRRRLQLGESIHTHTWVHVRTPPARRAVYRKSWAWPRALTNAPVSGARAQGQEEIKAWRVIPADDKHLNLGVYTHGGINSSPTARATSVSSSEAASPSFRSTASTTARTVIFANRFPCFYRRLGHAVIMFSVGRIVIIVVIT